MRSIVLVGKIRLQSSGGKIRLQSSGVRAGTRFVYLVSGKVIISQGIVVQHEFLGDFILSKIAPE